jgi:hypothetical protein
MKPLPHLRPIVRAGGLAVIAVLALACNPGGGAATAPPVGSVAPASGGPLSSAPASAVPASSVPASTAPGAYDY